MISIIVALKDEARDYIKVNHLHSSGGGGLPRFYVNEAHHHPTLVVSGVGRDRAQRATQQVLSAGPPSLIISVGFAGGVRGHLRPGELILCRRLYAPVEGRVGQGQTPDYIEAQDSLIVKAQEVLESTGLRYRVGASMALQRVATSPEKQWLGDNYPVDVVDMESYWVAATAAEQGVPCLALRAVLDPLEESLPALDLDFTWEGGSGWRSALRYVVKRPWKIPLLIRLSGEASAAQGQLSQALSALVPRLAAEVGEVASLS